MSEGGATRISMAEWLERPGSVGTPWPGVEVHILDDGGQPVPTGETGLIYVAPARWRSGSIPRRSRQDRDGVARRRVHRRRRRPPRRRRLPVPHRPRVRHGDPRRRERVPARDRRGAHQHPAVVDCAVFGVPDERLGEQLHAVVEARSPVDAGRAARALPRRTSPTSRCRPRSSSSTSSRVSPTARCSSACCATSTGPVATNRI